LPTRSVLFGARLLAARALLPDGAVFCGDTALWIHGVNWFSTDDSPIHVAMRHTDRIRRRDRLVVRARSLHPDDVVDSAYGPVTSVERTAYDVARDPLVQRSVPRLDALARATDPTADLPRVPDPDVILPPPCGIELDDVQTIVDRNPGARWIRRVHDALQLMDGGAQSPRESKVRLRVVTLGFPRLETQIEVFDGARFVARLDMGWRELQLGIEYDGAYHLRPAQAARDLKRAQAVEDIGWALLRIDKAAYGNEQRMIETIAQARSTRLALLRAG
jgi:very-short-patch-repair endonuclease